MADLAINKLNTFLSARVREEFNLPTIHAAHPFYAIQLNPAIRSRRSSEPGNYDPVIIYSVTSVNHQNMPYIHTDTATYRIVTPNFSRGVEVSNYLKDMFSAENINNKLQDLRGGIYFEAVQNVTLNYPDPVPDEGGDYVFFVFVVYTYTKEIENL